MNAPTNPTIPLLDLDLLKTLVAIAETGSFSAAAARVYRTPSAVSMQVKKMEDILTRPVFVRDSRSGSLTPDGAFLVDHARRMTSPNGTCPECCVASLKRTPASPSTRSSTGPSG